MEPVSEAIIIGTISGVATAWVLAFLNALMIGVVVPWYQEVIYRGVDIAGEWYGFREDRGAKYNFHISLGQRGSKITGLFTTIDEFTNKSTTKHFTLHGDIVGNHLVVVYSPRSRRTVGGGTFVLQVFDGGEGMRGAMSYMRTKTGTVEAKDDILLARLH